MSNATKGDKHWPAFCFLFLSVTVTVSADCALAQIPATSLPRQSVKMQEAASGSSEESIAPTTTKETSSYRLIVRMQNYAWVKPAVLLAAKHVADQVFSTIGIELVWFDVPLTHAELANSTASLGDLGGAVVYVSILPRSMTALAKLPESSLGHTPMTQEGECVTIASVYYDRIERSARYTSASGAQILGYAIAHELGHILLRTTHHSSTGIMIAKWRPTELQHAAQGLLGFSPQQAEYMRAEITGRDKTPQCLPH